LKGVGAVKSPYERCGYLGRWRRGRGGIPALPLAWMSLVIKGWNGIEERKEDDEVSERVERWRWKRVRE